MAGKDIFERLREGRSPQEPPPPPTPLPTPPGAVRALLDWLQNTWSQTHHSRARYLSPWAQPCQG